MRFAEPHYYNILLCILLHSFVQGSPAQLFILHDDQDTMGNLIHSSLSRWTRKIPLMFSTTDFFITLEYALKCSAILYLASNLANLALESSETRHEGASEPYSILKRNLRYAHPMSVC